MKLCLKLCWWLGLALVLVCNQAAARALVSGRAIFADAGAGMTLAQVRQAPFVEAPEIIGRGFTRDVLWLRLTVDAPEPAQALVLRLRPAVLDDVVLFLPDGRQQPVTERSLQLGAPGGQVTYYLRIRSSASVLFAADVLTPEQAQQDDVNQAMLLGAVLACGISLAIGILVLIVARHELLHVLFLLNLLVCLLVFLGWFGYLRAHFGPDQWPGSSACTHLLGILNVLTGFLFFRALLARFGLPRLGSRLFTLFFAWQGALLLLFFVLDPQWVLVCNTFSGLLATALCLPLSLRLFRHPRRSSRFIALVLVFSLLLYLRFCLVVWGLVAPDASSLNLSATRIFFITGIFYSILLLTDQEQQRALLAFSTHEAVARRLAESETQRRKTQERFMTMLMHELKTPLAIIQLAATSLGRHLLPGSDDARRVSNINASVDDLNAIVERCAQADQVDRGSFTIHKQLFSAQALAQDLIDAMGPQRFSLKAVSELTVLSDAHYVRLILQNLLSNALKYSTPDSMIELALEGVVHNGAHEVAVRVTNQVSAGGAPDPALVFGRYYRSEAARKQVGAGLGLWLARSLALQLGTDLHCRIDADRVAFHFHLGAA